MIVGAKLEARAGPRAGGLFGGGCGGRQSLKLWGRNPPRPFRIGAKMISGLGMTIEPVPGGDPIEPGRPANLVLKGAHDRVMRNGVWVE